MLIWVASIVTILIICVAAVWFYAKNPDRRLNLAETKLDRYLKSRIPSTQTVNKLLQQMHMLVNVSMEDANAARTYKAVDLLKLAYGSGLQRPNEYQRLGSIIVKAMRNKQPDIAVIALGAFRPLLRNLAAQDLSLAIEQLTLIAFWAARLKYNFLLAKILETVFDVVSRTECTNDQKILSAILNSIRIIGTLALRRQDHQLFRELATRFKAWTSSSGLKFPEEIEGVFITWLHQIAKNGDDIALEAVARLCHDFFDNQTITSAGVSAIVGESSKAAGTACLNQHNKVTPLILQFILELAAKSYDIVIWRKAVSAVGQVSSLAISRREMAEAFSVLLPMLDTGRYILTDELTFGEYSDDYRRKRLFIIVRECILLAELKARQDMTSSTGDVITEIYEAWIANPQTTGLKKSIKKYCQCLLLYWQSTRQRQARRCILDNNSLIEPILVADKDRKRLGL